MRISDWSSDVCSSDLTQLARATTTATASAPLEQPTTPKQPALEAETCDDAARKAAAATDDKPARSWAKRMQRRTTTSYRLTLSRPQIGAYAPDVQLSIGMRDRKSTRLNSSH